MASPDSETAPYNRQERAIPGVGWFSHIALRARLHADAIRLSPEAYFSGVWWRLLGKRLRARSRLSPLLGRSQHAYTAWLARGKGGAGSHSALEVDTAISGEVSPSPELTVVVEAGAMAVDLAVTLASLEAPEAAIVIEGVVGSLARRASFARVAERVGLDGGWLLPMMAGDMLAPGAQRFYSRLAAKAPGRVVYADDDERNPQGQLSAPYFKPDWNAELFRHHDYLSGASIIEVHGEAILATVDDPDWIARLTREAALQASEGCRPHHVPFILHHRAHRPRPAIPPAPNLPGLEQMPAVSVIIPTRNRAELLSTCLDGLARTQYPAMEIIIVDNDSDDPATLKLLANLDTPRHKVVRHAGPFNYSAINNAAVRHTKSPFLCFLNNDIEILDPDWLAILVAQAARKEVGAVGPMLLYPDGSVQHAGVVLGVGGGAAHAHRHLRPEDEGYFRRHALPQFVSAVTGACLVVRRDRFDAAGGFDEKNFPVAFNDVDLCLKLARLGHAAFYEPRTRLVHHESKSRGHDRDPVGAKRLARELAALKAIWGTDQRRDPYHHPSLSPYSEQFVLEL